MRHTARAVGIAGSLLLMATAVAPVFGASHREAPLTAADAATDHTDVYAWVDGNDATKVNFVVNVSPMQDPAGGPNFWQFDPSARYTIKIDNDRDAKADITYRFTFKTKVRNQGTFLYNTNQVTGVNDADLNVRQTYTVTRIKENGDSTVLGRDLPTLTDQRRSPLESELCEHGGRGGQDPARRLQGLCRSARRPVLRRPRIDLRSGRPAAVQRRACHPPREQRRDR